MMKVSTHQSYLVNRLIRATKRDKYLLIMVLPALVLLILFRYIPIYGVLIAFQKYRVGNDFLAGPWVGFQHFIKFINGPYFFRLTRNTFLLGAYSILWGFPLPIMLALMFNEIKDGLVKKVAQTISYLPYFISTVIIVGIIKEMMMIDGGKINEIIASLGGQKINFFNEARWFRTIYIGSMVWQGMGYNAIIYLAALSGVSPELYESATLDGATRLQKIRFISIPSIMPTVVVLFILAVGGIMGNDFTRIILIYSPATYETSDVISTYVYRLGLQSNPPQYSYSAAVGLFNSVISFAFLVSANTVSKRFSESSLW
jgi:putative aldouronate transport system permease protein